MVDLAAAFSGREATRFPQLAGVLVSERVAAADGDSFIRACGIAFVGRFDVFTLVDVIFVIAIVQAGTFMS